MTLEELSKELVYKPTYMKKHWTRILRYLSPKGIDLIKVGRGDAAQYGIKLWDEDTIRWEPNSHALDVEGIARQKEFSEWNAKRIKMYQNW